MPALTVHDAQGIYERLDEARMHVHVVRQLLHGGAASINVTAQIDLWEDTLMTADSCASLVDGLIDTFRCEHEISERRRSTGSVLRDLPPEEQSVAIVWLGHVRTRLRRASEILRELPDNIIASPTFLSETQSVLTATKAYVEMWETIVMSRVQLGESSEHYLGQHRNEASLPEITIELSPSTSAGLEAVDDDAVTEVRRR
jgi:hypothetical protein